MCDITPALTRQPNFFTSTSCTNQNERDALLVRKTGCTSTSLPPHQEIQERLNEGEGGEKEQTWDSTIRDQLGRKVAK